VTSEEGTDQRYGARHLKRAIERYLMLIDRHAGENGLAFLMDKEQPSCYAPMPFVASRSMQLATAEVRG
jgi:hypothetical protein